MTKRRGISKWQDQEFVVSLLHKLFFRPRTSSLQAEWNNPFFPNHWGLPACLSQASEAACFESRPTTNCYSFDLYFRQPPTGVWDTTGVSVSRCGIISLALSLEFTSRILPASANINQDTSKENAPVLPWEAAYMTTCGISNIRLVQPLPSRATVGSNSYLPTTTPKEVGIKKEALTTLGRTISWSHWQLGSRCACRCLTWEVQCVLHIAAFQETALEPGLRGEELPSDSSTPHEDWSAERVQSWRQSGHKNKEYSSIQKLHGGNWKPAWLSRKGKQNRNCRITSWSVGPEAVEEDGSQVCKLEVLMS